MPVSDIVEVQRLPAWFVATSVAVMLAGLPAGCSAKCCCHLTDGHDDCGSNEICKDSSLCFGCGSWVKGATGSCESKRALGESCGLHWFSGGSADDYCRQYPGQTVYCAANQRCEAKIPNGQQRRHDDEGSCLSGSSQCGWCGGNHIPDGQKCASDSNCASNFCSGGGWDSVDSLTDFVGLDFCDGTCKARRFDGQKAEDGDASSCESKVQQCGYCGSQHIPDGDSCAADANCQSGYCSGGVHRYLDWALDTIIGVDACLGSCKSKRNDGERADRSDSASCFSGKEQCEYCGGSHIPNGESCSSDGNCQSGFCEGGLHQAIDFLGVCNGKCASVAENGEPCLHGDHIGCLSGYCDDARTCQAKRYAGQQRLDGNDESCHDGSSRCGICGEHHIPVGSKCSDNNDCDSGFCDFDGDDLDEIFSDVTGTCNGICKAKVPDGEMAINGDGDSCQNKANVQQCGYCGGSHIPDGDSCAADANCISQYCSGGVHEMVDWVFDVMSIDLCYGSCKTKAHDGERADRSDSASCFSGKQECGWCGGNHIPEGEECTSDGNCDTGTPMYCHGGIPGSVEFLGTCGGRCTKFTPEGAICDGNRECATDFCACNSEAHPFNAALGECDRDGGVCRVKLRDGEPAHNGDTDACLSGKQTCGTCGDGGLSAGQRCDSDADCSSRFCAKSIGGVGIFLDAIGATSCNGFCHEKVADGFPALFGGSSSCRSGREACAICGGDGHVPNNGHCSNHKQCASGHCNGGSVLGGCGGTCQADSANGASCTRNAQCESDFCLCSDGQPLAGWLPEWMWTTKCDEGSCAARIRNGEPLTGGDEDACASRDSVCGFCGRRNVPDGESCISDGNCRSGTCDGGIHEIFAVVGSCSGTCKADKADGSRCGSDDECISSYCHCRDRHWLGDLLGADVGAFVGVCDEGVCSRRGDDGDMVPGSSSGADYCLSGKSECGYCGGAHIPNNAACSSDGNCASGHCAGGTHDVIEFLNLCNGHCAGPREPMAPCDKHAQCGDGSYCYCHDQHFVGDLSPSLAEWLGLCDEGWCQLQVADGGLAHHNDPDSCLSGTESCGTCGHGAVPVERTCSSDGDCAVGLYCHGGLNEVFDPLGHCSGVCQPQQPDRQPALGPWPDSSCASGASTCGICGMDRVVPNGGDCTVDADCCSAICVHALHDSFDLESCHGVCRANEALPECAVPVDPLPAPTKAPAAPAPETASLTLVADLDFATLLPTVSDVARLESFFGQWLYRQGMSGDKNVFGAVPAVTVSKGSLIFAVAVQQTATDFVTALFAGCKSCFVYRATTICPRLISELACPTTAPSRSPSQIPTATPSSSPSNLPSTSPSRAPSAAPSLAPSSRPTSPPSAAPSTLPSSVPSGVPTSGPTLMPSSAHSAAPSTAPSSAPSLVLPTVRKIHASSPPGPDRMSGRNLQPEGTDDGSASSNDGDDPGSGAGAGKETSLSMGIIILIVLLAIALFAGLIVAAVLQIKKRPGETVMSPNLNRVSSTVDKPLPLGTLWRKPSEPAGFRGVGHDNPVYAEPPNPLYIYGDATAIVDISTSSKVRTVGNASYEANNAVDGATYEAIMPSEAHTADGPISGPEPSYAAEEPIAISEPSSPAVMLVPSSALLDGAIRATSKEAVANQGLYMGPAVTPDLYVEPAVTPDLYVEPAGAQGALGVDTYTGIAPTQGMP